MSENTKEWKEHKNEPDPRITMEGTGEMINCKACDEQILMTKIVMHGVPD